MREIKLMDKETHEVFYDKLTFIYLEMPRFRKAESELETHFDKWLYVLKNLNRLQEKPVKFQERIFEKLFNEAEIAKLNPEEMDAYEKSLKSYRDQYSVLETARKEGASEREIEIARSMKQYGDPLEKIAAITGLSKEELEKL
jgi:predicted transposase/invertase (TIGR01784 family)